jgi:hypothetical protein
VTSEHLAPPHSRSGRRRASPPPAAAPPSPPATGARRARLHPPDPPPLTHAPRTPARPAPQVDLYENGTIAIVEAVSPELGNRVQRVRVQLPGTSAELLNKMREKKVDFAAHSNTEDGGSVFLNLLGAFGGC